MSAPFIDGCLLLDGRFKVGQASIGGIDVNIPELGFPLLIGRVYDSRNRRDGSFGPGWSLPHEAANVQAEYTYSPSEGWGEEARGSFLKTYYVISQTRKVLALRLGDGAVFKFRLDLSPKSSLLYPIMDASFPLNVIYTPQDGTQATLEPQNVSSEVFLLSENGGTLMDWEGNEYNPVRFKLTLEDGTVYIINQQTGIERITDPYGHQISYSDSQIAHSSGDVLTIERDTSNRVERITDQLGRTIEYHYDENGMLEQVIQQGEGPYAMKILENYAYQLADSGYFQGDETFARPVLKDILAPDGTRLGTFEYDSQGRKIGLIDHEGHRVLFGYDAPEHHYTVTDRRGNPTSYTYDSDGNVTAVTDAEGHTESYTYDAKGNVLSKTDKAGSTWSYTYDADSNVLSQTNPLGHTTHSTYDADGNKLTETDALSNTTMYTYDTYGKMLTSTDALGQTTIWEYDANGLKISEENALKQKTLFSYDGQGNMTNHTNAGGNTTRHAYNFYGQKLTTTQPLGNTTTWTYDPQGNVTSETDATGAITTFDYDAHGNKTAETDAAGQTTTYQYDLDGNLLQTTSALGQTTTSTYDPNGNQLTRTSRVTTSEGTVDVVTQYVYDTQNRQVEIHDPQGHVSITEYNAAGLTTATVDVLGRRTDYVYDASGQLVETHYPDGTTSRMTYDAAGHVVTQMDVAGRVTEYVYDALGRKISTIAPNGATTHSEYDAVGRVIRRIDALGHTTTLTYDADCNCSAGKITSEIDALGHTVMYEYDANGNAVAVIDANGQRTEFEYDLNNRATGTRFADGTSETITYDVLGRKIAETDQAGTITAFAYDALGRLRAVTDALGHITSYGYDENGNQARQTDANGQTTTYVYDNQGRRVKRILPLDMAETLAYDAVGNLISRTDFNGETTTFTYDIHDHLLTTTFPDGTSEQYAYTKTGNIATVQNALGTTSYTYDTMDRLLSVTDPAGQVISYTYDLNGNRTSVTTPSDTTTSTYDALNRLETVTDSYGGVTTTAYDAVGNVVRTVYPNQTRTDYQYDSLNRVIDVEHLSLAGTPFASFHYTLNLDGTRAQVQEQHGRHVQYQYDALKRLVEEHIIEPSGTEQIFRYTYDAVGNRLTKEVNGAAVTAYSYDANDRLLTEGTATYTYDNNGNTLSHVTPNGTTTYAYDGRNHLIRAELPGNRTPFMVEYRYDHDGIRVGKTINGSESIDYLVDKNRPYAQVLEERDATSDLLVRYVYGEDLISQHRAGIQRYYQYDGLGSTRALTDASGKVTDTYTYEAYGTMIDSQGESENAYLFAGEQHDPTLEFYYLRARYLNPSIGRFATMDTFEGTRGIPLSLHKYLYTNADPVNAIDPSGNLTLNEALIAGGIIVTAAGISAGTIVESFMYSPLYPYGSGDCGPDVTARLDRTVQDIRNTYDNDWGHLDRLRACFKVYDKFDDTWGGIANAWDIMPFFFIGRGDPASAPFVFGSSVTDGTSPSCGHTVAYYGKCHNAGYLNFILWGVIHQRCGVLYPRKLALFATALWKTGTLKSNYNNRRSLPEVYAAVRAGYHESGAWPLDASLYPNCCVKSSNRAPGHGPFEWVWEPIQHRSGMIQGQR